MEFEDYNYQSFNDHILVKDIDKINKRAQNRKERKEEKKRERICDFGGSDSDEKLKSKAPTPVPEKEEDPLFGVPRVPGTYGKTAKLAEKSLDALIPDDFSHKTLEIKLEPTDSEREREAQHEPDFARQAAERVAVVKAAVSDCSYTSSESDRGMTIYYKEQAIKEALDAQEQDVFDDLRVLKSGARLVKHKTMFSMRPPSAEERKNNLMIKIKKAFHDKIEK